MFPPRKHRSTASSLLLTAATWLGLAAPGFAYTTEEASWPNGDIIMQLHITSPATKLTDGFASLDASAADCLTTWNQSMERSKFVVAYAPGGFVPQDGDGINSVFSSSDIYGDSFDHGVLAVTLLGYEGKTMHETDVVLNTRYTFDSYRGPLRRTGLRVTEDAHRILLHEFGHVLGLDHPDEAGQNVEAIMNSRISDLDSLTDDDTAGAHYLYDFQTSSGGGTNSPASFARISAGKNQISQIVYSRATGNLYAIGKKKGRGANRLTACNPYTLEVVTGVDFPPSPDKLAVSDDGRYLYIARTSSLTAPRRISRLDLFLDVVDQDFAVTLPAAAAAPAGTIAHVIDMQAVPGNPGVLAVSEGYGGQFTNDADDSVGNNHGNFAVVIYENKTPRPAAFVQEGDFGGPTLLFAGNAKDLLALPSEPDTRAHHLTVGGDGVTKEFETYTVPSTLALAGYRYLGGNLYNSYAERIDAFTGTTTGTFNASGPGIANFTIDADTGRGFYLSGASPAIDVVNLLSSRLLGQVEAPAAVVNDRDTSSFITWGSHGLAIGSRNVRGLYVARSVTFNGDPLGGATPDTVTLKGPSVSSISQNAPGSLKFRARRESVSGDSTQEVTVRYRIAGTGVNGVNFKPLTGSVVIPARKSQVKFKLRPQPGSITDGQAVTVAISLAADPSYVIAAPAAATVAITP